MLNCFGPVRSGENIIGSVRGQGHRIYYFSVLSRSGQKITGRFGVGVPKTLPRKTLVSLIAFDHVLYMSMHDAFFCITIFMLSTCYLIWMSKTAILWYWCTVFVLIAAHAPISTHPSNFEIISHKIVPFTHFQSRVGVNIILWVDLGWSLQKNIEINKRPV